MFATSLVNVAPIVEGCSAYAKPSIISICRFLLMQGKGLGTIPHLCGVSLFVLFCSAFNSLLGLYLY
jgi:hypothetical protein